MPKSEVGATRFARGNGGVGTKIAIFDSGVDPLASGLRETPRGSAKVIDSIDCTGSGDVDTSQVQRKRSDGAIDSARGHLLRVHEEWKNPSGEWHVGTKRLFDLFTSSTIKRMKEWRKKRWEECHRKVEAQERASLRRAKLEEMEAKKDILHEKDIGVLDEKKKCSKEMESRIQLLQSCYDKMEDLGPILDIVCWHDGMTWRVAMEIDEACERMGEGSVETLASFKPMADYVVEHDARQFTSLDACSFCIHVYDDGNVVSIVTDSSAHGTHVAGIAAAYHEDSPMMNGVAPAAEVISCKIGDSRLQGMETGVGLTRAAIAAINAGVDLINMSYGEAAHTPNVGGFVDIAEELVRKHNITFVSSAGNEGPALSTVGAPGGTSSAILGVGAWVSADLASVGHSVREIPPLLNGKDNGLQYTWSSRGPTTDGDVGVDISAPGGAIAPVPQWSLEKRMLMNGTSMSSPSCCGALALLLSALKDEGVHVTPARIKRIIQATAKALGEGAPDAILSSGKGLIDVPAAFEYAMKEEKSQFCAKDAWFTIQVSRADGGTPMRGIYLRDPAVAIQESDFLVKVTPEFHEDADHLEHRIPMELKLELKCEVPWISFPEYLLLTHGGRSFHVRVDPTKLSEGLHFALISAFDSQTAGPLFDIPVTVIVPSIPCDGQGTRIRYSGIAMQAGLVERKFIAVPERATRAEITLKTGNNDTARTFILHAADSKPGRRHTDTSKRHYITLPPNDSKVVVHAVTGGTTLECTVAQFWGSLGSSSIDLEIQFHSMQCSSNLLVINGPSDMARVEMSAPLLPQELKPDLKLQRLQIPLKPFSSTLEPTTGERDLLPGGRRIHFLLLEYKLKLEVAGKVTPVLPTINNQVYDGTFESQMYMIFDMNKRLMKIGDIYPEPVSLAKGSYIIRLMLRHEKAHLLDQYKDHVLICERELEEPIALKCYNRVDELLTDVRELKSAKMFRGEHRSIYVAAPSADKLPKDARPGMCLVGKGTWTKPAVNCSSPSPDACELTYVVSVEPEGNLTKEQAIEIEKKTMQQRLEDSLLEATVKFVKGAGMDSNKEREDFAQCITQLLQKHAGNITLMTAVLNKLADMKDSAGNKEKIVEICDQILGSIDEGELAKFLMIKCIEDSTHMLQKKKKMEEEKASLIDALYHKSSILLEIGRLQEFSSTFLELRKWVDTTEPRYCMLHAEWEALAGRFATAIQILDKATEKLDEPAKRELYVLRHKFYTELGWTHIAIQESSTIFDRFPSKYPLF